MQSVQSKTWDHARSEYNHDWLKNRFLNRLDDAVLRLCGSVLQDDHILELLKDDMLEWDQKQEARDWIVTTAESHLSPLTLFGNGPLVYCNATMMSWLPSTMHQLWLARCKIKETVMAIQSHADRCDANALMVSQLLASGGACVIELHQALKDFTDQCRELSAAISALPHEVCVV